MEAIVKIDEESRIALPNEILATLHFPTATDLRASASKGKLEIVPVSPCEGVHLIWENGVLVADNDVKFDAVAALEADRAPRM